MQEMTKLKALVDSRSGEKLEKTINTLYINEQKNCAIGQLCHRLSLKDRRASNVSFLRPGTQGHGSESLPRCVILQPIVLGHCIH